MIKVKHNGHEYELEFTRQIVATLEARNFNYEEIKTKPNLMVPMLAQAAFLKNHKKISPGTVDAIYESLSDKSGFINALLEEFLEPTVTLFEEGNGGTWEKN
ncbi:MAG: DUF5055 domain-containing protein [Peptococcaceae bacterium]|nr:DUF5055 domain-containing protein [Peptococcaceae bacterium]